MTDFGAQWFVATTPTYFVASLRTAIDVEHLSYGSDFDHMGGFRRTHITRNAVSRIDEAYIPSLF